MATKQITWQDLTDVQQACLMAMIDCDSVSSEDHRLQVLNRLAAMGLAEPFDSEPSYTGKRVYVWFTITDKGRNVYAARHTPEQPAAVTLDGLDAFLAAYVTMETLAARHGWFNRFNSTHLLQEMELVAWRYKHQQLHPVNTRVRFSELVNCRAEVLWWAIEDARIDWQYGGELLDLPQLRGYSHKNERGEAIPREVQR